MGPVRAIANRPAIALLGVVLLLIGGFTSYREMPVDLFPDLDYPLINIITHYPAGTSEDMELLVTRPIENSVQDLQGLRRVRSVSTPGLSQVTVEFVWGMDVLAARQLVISTLAQARNALPSGAEPQLENIGSSLAMISTYTISGADPTVLRSWAQYTLAAALTSIPGVERVQVMGGGQTALRADLDPASLLAHHLSAETVVSAIRRANVLGTGGFVEAYGRDLLISTRGQIRDLDDLRQVMVAHDRDGTPVLLADVGRLYAGTLPERYAITADRGPAVAFNIQKQRGASTLNVSQQVDAALGGLSPPAGARLEKFYDQAEIIGLAYRNMRDQLLLGAALAALTLFIILGRHRTTWVVVISIPLSVTAAFILMRWAGFGINLMTLGALTVTIGMINDDSILVLENIFRHRQMGKAPLPATVEGLREILGADVAGTLTTVAAFVPLVLLTGLAGRLFLPFGLTFAFVLSLSLLFSLTLIPLATARLLPAAGVKFETSQTIGARWIPWVVKGNRRLLDRLLKHRSLTILGAVALMAGCTALLVLNPVRYLPLLDEQSLLLSYQLAPGTGLSESNRIGDQLEAIALAQTGVEAVFRRTGSPENSYFVEGPDEGELVLRINPAQGLNALQVKTTLNARLASIPGILTRINEPTSERLEESFSGLPALFGITVLGNNLDTLHAAALHIEQAARRTPGVANVVNNTKVPVDTLTVDIDRAACARYGVAPKTVADAVQLAMQGVDAGQSAVDGRIIHLFVRYTASARRNADDLARVLVPEPNQRAIPLSQLAQVHQVNSYPSIEHQFGSRALTMPADIVGNPYTVMARLNAAIARLGLTPDIRVEYTGEYQQLIQTAGQMLWILLASAILVYGIMAIQLGNWLDPAVVLVKLPIDFMGAALALFITRQELDFTVMIGFVTLVGIGVNNGIVLLHFVGGLRRAGLDAVSAVQQAVEVRTRPMLLTQITTILALIPAALGIGAGPQLLQNLGIMLFGGLIVGAVLTLNLLPVIYVATERWRKPVSG